MTIIPLLATQNLGLSLLALGAIEGGSEFVCMILRVISGNSFDKFRNRQALFSIPGIMSLFSKAILVFPSGWGILTSKLLDRMGNGMFSVPRDAYVGQVSQKCGKSLSYMNMSKALGCILGPLIISISCFFYGSINHNIHTVIILMCVLNTIAFGMSFLIDLNKLHIPSKDSLSIGNIKSLLNSKDSRFNTILLITFLFFMGRFNDGTIMLYLKHLGFPEWFYISTIAFFNMAMLIISPLFGYFVDKGKIYNMLLLTVTALICFNVIFINVHSISFFMASAGLICWGVQRVGERITLPSMIFSSVSKSAYGTAIGIYSVLSGLGTFVSSLICGYLGGMSYSYIFLFSAFFGIVTLATILGRKYEQRRD